MSDQRKAAIIRRFMSKIYKSKSGCWLWTGSISKKGKGYGWFRLYDSSINSHRAAWLLFRGPIRGELFVCHECDVKRCVNPSHLFLGTSFDNAYDAKVKGRLATGLRNGRGKLSTTQVRRMKRLRKLGMSGEQLSAEFGVTRSHVYNVCEGFRR